MVEPATSRLAEGPQDHAATAVTHGARKRASGNAGRAVVQVKEAGINRNSMVDLEKDVLAPPATASPVLLGVRVDTQQCRLRALPIFS